MLLIQPMCMLTQRVAGDPICFIGTWSVLPVCSRDKVCSAARTFWEIVDRAQIIPQGSTTAAEIGAGDE